MNERNFEGWHKPDGALKFHYFTVKFSRCHSQILLTHPPGGYLFAVPKDEATCKRCQRSIKARA